jgi:hypothetical protein
MAAPFNDLTARFYVPITPGSSNLADGVCKAIHANEAGNVDLTQEDGTVRADFPLVAGPNFVRAKVINTPTTGTAPSSVWALY